MCIIIIATINIIIIRIEEIKKQTFLIPSKKKMLFVWVVTHEIHVDFMSPIFFYLPLGQDIIVNQNKFFT